MPNEMKQLYEFTLSVQQQQQIINFTFHDDGSVCINLCIRSHTLKEKHRFVSMEYDEIRNELLFLLSFFFPLCFPYIDCLSIDALEDLWFHSIYKNTNEIESRLLAYGKLTKQYEPRK